MLTRSGNVTMKKLSKAQRRALEILARGKRYAYIHWKTMTWLRDCDLALGIVSWPGKHVTSLIKESVLTCKGKAWLDADRKLRPIVQCQNCGAWRSHDIYSIWAGNTFKFNCHVCPLSLSVFYWRPSDNYPEWIADE